MSVFCFTAGMQTLLHKKVLVLAGPTWVRIDQVRAITNIFSGEMGLRIAREFHKRGARVTLLFGRGRRELITAQDRFNIVYFDYFEELLSFIHTNVRTFDVVVNSAAIADYQPMRVRRGKIASKKTSLVLQLKPTPKIIDVIRRCNPHCVLVKFKLEVNKSKSALLAIAARSLRASQADYIVANDLRGMTARRQRAYILDAKRNVIPTQTKVETARVLARTIAERFEKQVAGSP
jgi:phosphopantothenoylcysteine synthetase/decarboxylase